MRRRDFIRVRRQRSTGMSTLSWNDAMPALVTRRSTAPLSDSMARNIASIASKEATSAR